MRIEKCQHIADSVKVHVDADELDCGQKLLPYPTCIGVVNMVTGKISVWTPAASKPRGYRKAAERMLEDVATDIKKGGDHGVALRVGRTQ